MQLHKSFILFFPCFYDIFQIKNEAVPTFETAPLPVIVCLLLFASCSTTSDFYGYGNSNKTSMFANFDELGMDKDSFLKKFGTPTNKEIYVDDQNNLIEVLYYTELLNYDKIAVTTKFRFKNNILIEQKNEEMINYIDKKMLDAILREVRISRGR
ncbi:hypothetical protein C0T31_12130 [Dysgonamonadaceae bacterium]|nr:hypothetical protein C0T31_12130 [Dysgonamonadaceae bacterium]